MIRSRGIFGLIALLLIIVLLAGGCAATGAAPNALAPRATSTTLPVTSSVAQSTIEAAQVAQYLSQIQAEKTTDAYHAIQTATAVADQRAAAAAAATSTQQAWVLTAQAEAARATATAVAHATATAIAELRRQQTATALDAQATATAKSEELHIGWTVTAQVRAAAAADAEATATAQSVATNESFENALREEQLTRERLETRRAELVQPLRAYGPWVILCAVLALLGLIFWQCAQVLAERQRVIETLDGTLVLRRKRVELPGRNWGPILEYDPQQRALPTPGQQDAVTERAQKISAIRATHPPEGHGRASQAVQRQAMQLLGEHRQAPGLGLGRVQALRRLTHAVPAGLLTPQLGAAIAADWQRNVVEGKYRDV